MDDISQEILSEVLLVNDLRFVEFEGELYLKNLRVLDIANNGHMVDTPRNINCGSSHMYELTCLNTRDPKVIKLEQFALLKKSFQLEQDHLCASLNLSEQQLYIQKFIRALMNIQEGNFDARNTNFTFRVPGIGPQTIINRYLWMKLKKLENENTLLRDLVK